MSYKYLNLSGLEDLWTNIKNYILSKIPTKTSELTNDSGYLTSHQSLDNYVTLNSSQTITAVKVITGGNQGKMLFKNPNYTKGDAVESGVTISRIYFGNGASYATANGVLTTDINSAGNTSMELCAMNNTASNSNRASLILTYDKSATRPRMLKSWGDFIPYTNNNYTLGNTSNIWKECYCNTYYLGSTAFGDIVTHNASEFLTEHQSLADYALDANVVHTSGDETIAGKKSFSAMPSILGSYLGNEFSTNARTCLYLKSNRDTDGQSGIYLSKFRQNVAQGALTGSSLVSLSFDVLENSVRTNSCIAIQLRYFENDVPTKVYVIPKASVTSYMGTSDNPWTSIYGTDIYGSFTGNLTGDVAGNASSATEFSANQDVILTGDVTGTASSKAGWSVTTTLSNSGVTAGTYGPSADVTGSNNTTILVPEITVDAKGRVTNVTNRTYTSVNSDSDKKCYQYYKSDNNVHRVMFSNVTGNTATSNVGANYACLNNAFYANPSTGSFYATKLYSGGTEVSVSGHTHTMSDITDISSLGLDTVLQTNATDDTSYPILLGATANNSNTTTDSTKFNTSLKANPRYGLIGLTNTFDTSAGRGVKPSADTEQGVVAMYTQDTDDECASLRAYAYSNGTRGIYMHACNWSDGTDVTPLSLATGCTLGAYVDKTGFSYCKSSTDHWDNSFLPRNNEIGSLGNNIYRWNNVYAKSVYADYISGDRSCDLKLNLTSWSTSTFSYSISGVANAPIYIMGNVTFKSRPFIVTLSFSGVTSSSGDSPASVSLSVTAGANPQGDMTQKFFIMGFATTSDITLTITRSDTQGNTQPTAFNLKVYQ